MDVALRDGAGRDAAAQLGEVNRPIDADRVGSGLGHDPRMTVETRATGEDDDTGAWNPRTDTLDHFCDWLQGPARQGIGIVVRQRPGMGFEDLHRIGSRLELAHQVLGLHGHQTVNERFDEGGVAPCEFSGRSEVGSTATADHVARDGPRGATETEQSGLVGQLRPQAFHSLEHGSQMIEDRRIAGLAQSLELCTACQTIQSRPFALDKADVLAKSVGYDEDVGEQDRCLEAEPSDRL